MKWSFRIVYWFLRRIAVQPAPRQQPQLLKILLHWRPQLTISWIRWVSQVYWNSKRFKPFFSFRWTVKISVSIIAQEDIVKNMDGMTSVTMVAWIHVQNGDRISIHAMIGVLEIAFIWIFHSFSTAKTVTSKVVVLSTVNIQINRYM